VDDHVKALFGGGRSEVFVDLADERVGHHAEEDSRRLRLVPFMHPREAGRVVCRQIMKHVVRSRRLKDRAHPGPTVHDVVGTEVEHDVVAEA
jgi:hypothetical protein